MHQCVVGVFEDRRAALRAIETVAPAPRNDHERRAWLLTPGTTPPAHVSRLLSLGDDSELFSMYGAAVGGPIGAIVAGGLVALTVANAASAGIIAFVVLSGLLLGGIVGGFVGSILGWGVHTRSANPHFAQLHEGRFLVVVETAPQSLQECYKTLSGTGDAIAVETLIETSADDDRIASSSPHITH